MSDSTHDLIENYLGDMSPEEFVSEAQIRAYFDPSELRAMFGADASLHDREAALEAVLAAWSEAHACEQQSHSVYRAGPDGETLSDERAQCEICGREGWRGDYPGQGGIVPDHRGNMACDECAE